MSAGAKNGTYNPRSVAASVRQSFCRCFKDAALKTFSDGYIQTQERLLFLFDHVPGEKRFAVFELECYKRAPAPTTAHTY